jgi:hypothetical protein
MQIKCPDIDPQFIRYLDTVFPDIAANPAEEDPAVAYGVAKVVRHLKAVFTQQQESDI